MTQTPEPSQAPLVHAVPCASFDRAEHEPVLGSQALVPVWHSLAGSHTTVVHWSARHAHVCVEKT